MTPELKPCPFCGGEAHLEPLFTLVGVLCNGCGALTDAYKTCDGAVAAWNRRVGDDLMERMVDDGK